MMICFSFSKLGLTTPLPYFGNYLTFFPEKYENIPQKYTKTTPQINISIENYPITPTPHPTAPPPQPPPRKNLKNPSYLVDGGFPKLASIDNNEKSR